MAASSDELVTVGRIRTVYGVKGWLKVESFTQPAENLFEYGEWTIQCSGKSENAGPVKVSCDEFRRHNNDIVVHLQGLDDREQARRLSQCFIAVPKSAMPALDGEEFYWHQLEGLQAFQLGVEGEDQLLGVVDHLLETGANDVLVVKRKGADDILIPYLPGEVVKHIDLQSRRILVDWYYD